MTAGHSGQFTQIIFGSPHAVTCQHCDHTTLVGLEPWYCVLIVIYFENLNIVMPSKKRKEMELRR